MAVTALAAHGLLFRPTVMLQGVVAHVAAEAMMSAPQVRSLPSWSKPMAAEAFHAVKYKTSRLCSCHPADS